MSFNYFDNIKYQYSPIKYKILAQELNLKKALHKFEMSPLKNKAEILKFQKNVILPHLKSIKDLQNNIKGFNLEAFFISIAIFHTAYIYKKNILLNEMGIKALRHMFICLTIGSMSGIIFGNYYGKSYGLYRGYNKTLKNVKKINDDFEYYYIGHHEEEFDE